VVRNRGGVSRRVGARSSGPAPLPRVPADQGFSARPVDRRAKCRRRCARTSRHLRRRGVLGRERLRRRGAGAQRCPPAAAALPETLGKAARAASTASPTRPATDESARLGAISANRRAALRARGLPASANVCGLDIGDRSICARPPSNPHSEKGAKSSQACRSANRPSTRFRGVTCAFRSSRPGPEAVQNPALRTIVRLFLKRPRRPAHDFRANVAAAVPRTATRWPTDGPAPSPRRSVTHMRHTSPRRWSRSSELFQELPRTTADVGNHNDLHSRHPRERVEVLLYERTHPKGLGSQGEQKWDESAGGPSAEPMAWTTKRGGNVGRRREASDPPLLARS